MASAPKAGGPPEAGPGSRARRQDQSETLDGISEADRARLLKTLAAMRSNLSGACEVPVTNKKKINRGKLRDSVRDDSKGSPEANVRHLDHVRSEHRGEEPRGLARDATEARADSSAPSNQKSAPNSNKASKRWSLRPVLFALLPVALVIEGICTSPAAR